MEVNMKQESVESPELYKDGQDNGRLAGGFLILMGLIFFLGMTGVSILGKSAWMLIALLPVYWIGVMAYKRYREDGRLSPRVFSILVFGLPPFAYIAAIFLGLNVSALWPVGLIAVGVSFLLFGSRK
jgi:hypothetical protein